MFFERNSYIQNLLMTPLKNSFHFEKYFISDNIGSSVYSDNQICWKSYRIVAVAFHIGNRTSSGHWRAALFHQNKWFVYDDGRLPDQMDHLTPDIQAQVTQIWLINLELDRTPLAAAVASAAAPSVAPVVAPVGAPVVA